MATGDSSKLRPLTTFEQLKEIIQDKRENIPKFVEFEESLQENGRHAVHACIYALRSDFIVGLESFDKTAQLNLRANILMQLRFDGQLGFAGGLVDDPVNGLTVEEARHVIVESLARELNEEINFDTSKYVVTNDDYLFSTRTINLVRSPRPLFLHFYGYRVTPAQFLEIEKNSLSSREHGREVMGNVRVPLYTMADGYRGLPAFLRNRFIGTAKSELLFALLHYEIMTKEELQTAIGSTSSQPLNMGSPPR